MIEILSTGGTIDKVYGSGIGIRDLHIGEPFASQFLKKNRLPFPSSSKELMRLDSLDMTDEDRRTIVEACGNSDSAHIIITHGTDTMIQTALAIHESGACTGKRRIVLTGALLPACMKDSDAEFNLGLAIATCLTALPGIYIAMHGVYTWDKCYKDPETGIFLPKPKTD